MSKHSLLVVFAHPDDEMTIGPLLAKYVREGHDVYLVSITSGQKGVRAHAGLPEGDSLGAIREEEVRCAARELGVHEPFLLGFQDQGIGSMAAVERVAARLREIVDRTRPDVLVTFGPDGITGHPDHRATCDIATLVFQEQALLEHKPRKLYYSLFPESLFLGNRDPLNRRRPFHTVSDVFVTTEVDCREWLDVSFRALHCHGSQFTPERMREIQEMYVRILGGRNFFRLALSCGPPPQRRETSLFEGLE